MTRSRHRQFGWGLKTTLLRAAPLAVGLGLLGAAPAAAQEADKPAVLRGDESREWHLRDRLGAGPATTTFRYGLGADIALICDWNGDGTRTPVAVRRSRFAPHLEWHFRDSHAGGPADVVLRYGRNDTFDEPVCGDWNGDGVQTPGIVRQRWWSDGRLEWHLRNAVAGGAADVSFVYGRPDGMHWLVVGDWTGDGVETPGVVYNRARLEWHLRTVNRGGAADRVFRYGLGDPEPLDPELGPQWDSPVVGDWNGDDRATAGVVREHHGRLRWLLKDALRGGAADHAFTYGRSTDQALVWR